jgi:hypothetical protein
MEAVNEVNDDVVDTDVNPGSGADTATQTVDNGGAGNATPDNGDNNAAIQQRMADDSPWYSPSEGKVVTVNGDVIVNPKTKQPFTSIEDFNRWDAANKAAITAKPKTEQGSQQQKQPMSTSFDALMTGGEQLTPERLQEFSKAGSDYKYNDGLIPALDPNIPDATKDQAIVDPVERVKSERKNIETVAVQPIREIRDLLIKQGADIAAVDELLAPIMQKQAALVESHYTAAYEKALEERLDGKYGSRLSKIDEEKLNNASEANIDALARKYYPKGGKDALFSLINGHYEQGADGKRSFVRGPAAQVIDLLTSIAVDGKKFKTEQERSAAYANTFRRLTADPAKAGALVDIAHNYWLGKKSSEALSMVYKKGKESAQIQNLRAQRTFKTPPASYTPPKTDDEDGMPKKGTMMRSVMDGIKNRY